MPAPRTETRYGLIARWIVGEPAILSVTGPGITGAMEYAARKAIGDNGKRRQLREALAHSYRSLIAGQTTPWNETPRARALLASCGVATPSTCFRDAGQGGSIYDRREQFDRSDPRVRELVQLYDMHLEVLSAAGERAAFSRDAAVTPDQVIAAAVEAGARRMAA